MSTAGAGAADRQRTERWLRRHGVPHLIAGYSPTRGVLNRAAPLLSLVFLIEVSASLNLRFTWWQNALALLAAIGIALLAVAAVNRLRGRALLQVPDRFGWPETIGFLVVPAALPLLFGDQVRQAATLLGGNLLLLALIYAWTSYAVWPLSVWAARLAWRLLGNVTAVMGRTLPTLLLFSVFMFINADMWAVAAAIPLPFYAVTLALFVALGTAFALVRLPGEFAALSTFDSWEQVRRECGDTPVADLSTPDGVVPDLPLDRAARRNVGLLGLVGVGLQALAVSVLVTVFYTLFGLVTIGWTTFHQWVGAAPHVLGPVLHVGGGELFLSRELLVTAGFIGVVAGLQFVVSALSDPTFREEFLDRVRADLRRAFAVRAVYLCRLVPGRSDPYDAVASARTNAS